MSPRFALEELRQVPSFVVFMKLIHDMCKREVVFERMEKTHRVGIGKKTETREMGKDLEMERKEGIERRLREVMRERKRRERGERYEKNLEKKVGKNMRGQKSDSNR